MKEASGQMVGHLVEKELLFRCSPSQLEETDLFPTEQDFATHQPSGPMGIHSKGMSQHGYFSYGVGTPNKNDSSRWMGLQVESPAFRKGIPRGCGLPSHRRATAMRGHILGRSGLKC